MMVMMVERSSRPADACWLDKSLPSTGDLLPMIQNVATFGNNPATHNHLKYCGYLFHLCFAVLGALQLERDSERQPSSNSCYLPAMGLLDCSVRNYNVPEVKYLICIREEKTI